LFELTIYQWIIFILSALLTGFSKTSGTGLGTFLVPLMVDAFEARVAIGLLFPLFLLGSVHAFFLYFRDVRWDLFLRLALPTALGITIGAITLYHGSGDFLRVAICAITLFLLALNLMIYFKKERMIHIRETNIFLIVIGLSIGFSSTVAHMASPLMICYLLTLDLDKRQFVGTLSTFMLIVNVIKAPINIYLGILTYETAFLNVKVLPVMIFGGLLGVLFLRFIPTKKFRVLVHTLTLLSALKLLATILFA